MKIIPIKNKTQLLATKYKYKYIIYLVFGEKCEPCQELKPKLINFLQKNDSIKHEFNLVLVNYKSSKKINEYFNLKKIPFLIFCMDSKIRNSIQSSKMELILPILNEAFDLNLIEDEEELDFTGDFDF